MNIQKFLNDTRLYLAIKPGKPANGRSATCERISQCVAARVYQSKFSRASIAEQSCGICRTQAGA
jgi:hypothetical protein